MPRPLIQISPESMPYAREDRIKKEVFFLENRRSNLIRKMKEEPERSVREKMRSDLAEVETEVCYLQRELGHRDRRKKAHTEFLKKRRANRANTR